MINIPNQLHKLDYAWFETKLNWFMIDAGLIPKYAKKLQEEIENDIKKYFWRSDIFKSGQSEKLSSPIILDAEQVAHQIIRDLKTHTDGFTSSSKLKAIGQIMSIIDFEISILKKSTPTLLYHEVLNNFRKSLEIIITEAFQVAYAEKEFISSGTHKPISKSICGKIIYFEIDRRSFISKYQLKETAIDTLCENLYICLNSDIPYNVNSKMVFNISWKANDFYYLLLCLQQRFTNIIFSEIANRGEFQLPTFFVQTHLQNGKIKD